MTSRFIILIAAVVLTLTVGPSRAAAADDGRQYYELRVYITKSAEQQKRINDYWQNAAVPAYNRLGVQPIGVFTEIEDSPTNKIYVLLPADSLEALHVLPAKLAADMVYQKAAADFLNATKADAPYERFETSLLVAFDGMKRMSLPSADKKSNVFELRNYISPSEDKGLNKIKMFESGEIDVMKEVGLAPIFYSRMLVGSTMPSLVYMTCGENMDEHKKHWTAFGNATVWKNLQADPQFKDNVSTIIKVILKRTSASQI
jgi:NIPSNAP